MDFSFLISGEEPKTLYHYTSLDALVKIVQSKRIRASNIRFLNDSSESVWLKRHVIALLRKRSCSLGEQEVISATVADIESQPQQSLFVASFTEKANDLSQWRAYCPPGLGVSIGFSTRCLGEQWVADARGGGPSFLSAFLQKVRYYSPDNEAELEGAVDRLLRADMTDARLDPKFALGFTPDSIPLFVKAALNQEGIEQEAKIVALRSIRVWLTLLSPFFKHDAFQGESEWRKVISKDSRLMPGQQFRQGNSTLIPFVEIMLDTMTEGAEAVAQPNYFIDEVVIGPTPHPELTTEAVQALFASEGHPEVIVRGSNIPFRSW